MTRFIIAIAIALTITSTPSTAQTIYRDNGGRIIGTSRDTTLPGSNASTEFYDASGRQLGSITGDGFGGAYVRDDQGRSLGTIDGE